MNTYERLARQILADREIARFMMAKLLGPGLLVSRGWSPEYEREVEALLARKIEEHFAEEWSRLLREVRSERATRL